MTLSARRVAEELTHRVVVRRHLPRPYQRASFYVSSEGGLRYLRPSLRRADPALVRFVERYVRRGDIVWDIGANLGLFTCSAAYATGPGGRVVAVEPDPWLAALLRRSVRANRWTARVKVLGAAAADRFGIGTLLVARRSRSTSHLDAAGLGSTQTGGVRERQLVPLIPLDGLLGHIPPPTVLKVDVEGAEVLVLQGATHVLEHRPCIAIEVASRHAPAIASMLEPLGYQFFDGDHPGQPRVSAPPYFTVAIPIER